MLGTWTPLGQVSAVEEFTPGEEIDPTLPRYRSITLKERGFTDSPNFYWSGSTFMDITRGKEKSLAMQVKRIGDSDYLFIEAGGFTFYEDRKTFKQPRTWHSPWFVLKRVGK